MRACNSASRTLDNRGGSVPWSVAFSNGGGEQSDKRHEASR
jgi:hypothetical protein